MDDGPRPRAAKKRSGGVLIIPPTGVEFLINDGDSSQPSDESEVEIPAVFEMLVVVEAPAAPAAPAAPGAAPLRARLGDFSFKWKGFTISRVRKNYIQIGWGLTCNKHHDYDESGLVVSKTPCKINLIYGVGANAIPDDECIVRLKRWAKASSV